MPVSDELLHTLRTWNRLPGSELVGRLKISRPTLMRAVRALGGQVIARGKARRTAYAAHREIRGSMEPFALYRVDAHGGVEEAGALFATYPHGCVLDLEACEWPLDADMSEGWFDGIPYFLDDMRPQGFLGRQFARAHASLLQVHEDPKQWPEDDVLHTLSLLGSDQPGCYILGEPALRGWLARRSLPTPALTDTQIGKAYVDLAAKAMGQGAGGSSAGGEFPKFTAVRRVGKGNFSHVIVKFSGSDPSPGTQRWADLLVCEHLAALTLQDTLGIDAAASGIHRFGGRTFLEVHRFDRHGEHGRSPVCSWAALNGGLFGTAAKSWVGVAAALADGALIDRETRQQIEVLWHFGQLIANSDMHDGNLSFLPGLRLSPVYDMLPMLYAPERGVELPERAFQPVLPIPGERDAWLAAHQGATLFWQRAAADSRVSAAFRRICDSNAGVLEKLRAG